MKWVTLNKGYSYVFKVLQSLRFKEQFTENILKCLFKSNVPQKICMHKVKIRLFDFSSPEKEIAPWKHSGGKKDAITTIKIVFFTSTAPLKDHSAFFCNTFLISFYMLAI